MDKFVHKELGMTKSAQEKLQKERENRGAEQLTPKSREELLQKAEGLRRMIADIELRQQKEKDDRLKSQEEDEEAVARLSHAFGKNLPSVVVKVHEEGASLSRFMQVRDERDGGDLQKQLEAIEADLGSGVSPEIVVPHSPEDEVLETSKELMPDMKQETAAKLEHPDVELPHLTESAPFPVDRMKWSDADFERHHQAMKSLPCIRGYESYKKITSTIEQLADYHEQEPDTFWQESVQSFEPRQVVMRYDGEDWSYAFHTQPKYGEKTNDEESSVTGIAKKIVKEIPHLVKEYKTEIDAAEPEQRSALEQELVEKVENVFSDLYQPDQQSENVRVEKIEGPRGPVFITEDGNHRLAAARLIDLKRVRGIVKEPKDPATKKDFWYELLATLPADQSRQLQELYLTIYPADEGAQETDVRELEKARQRLPEIQSTLAKKETARRTVLEQVQKDNELKQEETKKRYAYVDRMYSLCEGEPGFQETLHQEGLNYLWERDPQFMEGHYIKQIDSAGWIKRKGGGTSHIFGIDLDMGPLRTENEIKYRAIKKYAAAHPERHIEDETLDGSPK